MPASSLLLVSSLFVSSLALLQPPHVSIASPYTRQSRIGRPILSEEKPVNAEATPPAETVGVDWKPPDDIDAILSLQPQEIPLVGKISAGLAAVLLILFFGYLIIA